MDRSTPPKAAASIARLGGKFFLINCRSCGEKSPSVCAVHDMSLAFRFKAGGSGGNPSMAPTMTSVHHHRSTTKQEHKPFKSRHASKSALKDAAKGGLHP